MYYHLVMVNWGGQTSQLPGTLKINFAGILTKDLLSWRRATEFGASGQAAIEVFLSS